MIWEIDHPALVEIDEFCPEEERHIIHHRIKKNDDRWNKEKEELVQACEVQAIEPYVD
jgi:hypothetical protein